ncbi:MAG: hypothetical protein MJ211_16285, partial [Bacteroidales bacterium]|nr:hypothetical protein [Bacteroidales bacterium]
LFLCIICFNFAVYSETKVISDTQKEYVKNLTITKENMNELPANLESKIFYNIDVFIENPDADYCEIRTLDEKNKSLVYEIIPENNGHFTKKIYTSAKSKLMNISITNKDKSQTLIASFSLSPANLKADPVVTFDKKTQFYTVTINHTNFENVPSELTAGYVYKFNVNLEEFDEDVCYFLISNNDPLKNYPYTFVKNKNNSFLWSMYLPKDTKNFTLQMQKDDYSNKLLVGYFTPSQKSKSYKFKKPSSYHEAFKYKTNLKDERIISYLESIDARKMCQTSPDDVLELCITKINSLAQNDFEKVKLIHDAIWYLVSYDIFNAEKIARADQDYITNLKTGLCVCEGFALLFMHMCNLADIDCIHVFGDGRRMNLLKNDPRYINHAWNMVRINGCWYLTDVCWDCSHFKDGVRDDFYSTDYLFNKPVFFITSHFPMFKELQLLKPAINKDFSGYFIYPQQQQ